MDYIPARPITYSFRSTFCGDEDTLRIQAHNLIEAYNQLPHPSYRFIEAIDAKGVRVYE